MRRARITSDGSLGAANPEILAVRANPTIAGSPGLECCIVPRVKELKPRLPCATSIALQTVGVSTCRSNASNSSEIIASAILLAFYLLVQVVLR